MKAEIDGKRLVPAQGSTLCNDADMGTTYCSISGLCVALAQTLTTNVLVTTSSVAAQPTISLLGPQTVEITQELPYQRCPDPPPTIMQQLACDRGANALDPLDKDLSNRLEACSSATTR